MERATFVLVHGAFGSPAGLAAALAAQARST